MQQQQLKLLLTDVLTSGWLTPSFLLWITVWNTLVELAGRDLLLVRLLYTVFVGAMWILHIVLLFWFFYIVATGAVWKPTANRVTYLVLVDFLTAHAISWTSTAMFFWIWNPQDEITFLSNVAGITSAWSMWLRLFYMGILLGATVGYGRYMPVHLGTEAFVAVRVYSDVVLLVFILSLAATLAVQSSPAFRDRAANNNNKRFF